METERNVLERLSVIVCMGIEGNLKTRDKAFSPQDFRDSFERNVVAYRKERNKAAKMGADVSGFDQRVLKATGNYMIYTREDNISITPEGVNAKGNYSMEARK